MNVINDKKGGFLKKNIVIKGSLLIDFKKEFKEDINISSDYELYKGMDSSLITKLSKNFKKINFKFNKNETLIKIYIFLTDDSELYHRGFYKNKADTDSGVINYEDYILKQFSDSKTIDDYTLLKNIEDELNRLNNDSYYITYTINNYKNYFFYINQGEENLSILKSILDQEFSTEVLDKTLSDTMIKIKKNIIKLTTDE
jgi:hypothetical protein